jgi:hypothetical protein
MANWPSNSRIRRACKSLRQYIYERSAGIGRRYVREKQRGEDFIAVKEGEDALKKTQQEALRNQGFLLFVK